MSRRTKIFWTGGLVHFLLIRRGEVVPSRGGDDLEVKPAALRPQSALCASLRLRMSAEGELT